MPRRVSDRITAYALYTDPPLGRAGMTEAEVRKRPAGADRNHGHGGREPRVREGRDQGVHEDPGRSGEASRSSAPRCSGLAGDEVIHCILDLMYAKAPSTVMQRAMHIHPTVSEFVPTMLGDLVPLQSASAASTGRGYCVGGLENRRAARHVAVDILSGRFDGDRSCP